MLDPAIAVLMAREVEAGRESPAKVLVFRLSDEPEVMMKRKAREIMAE